jgi:hypothetical protein
MIDWTRLRLPVMQAPMVIAANLDLVMASCKAGVIGAFPVSNPRGDETLEGWLTALADAEARTLDAGGTFAPYCVNLLAARQIERDLKRQRMAICRRYNVPLILTNLGDPREEVEAAHEWGGLVFHDVTTMRFAEKAIEAGVDGLMLVCGGAGGHAGTLNPFSFLPQVRRIFDGPIMLAGGIADWVPISWRWARASSLRRRPVQGRPTNNAWSMRRPKMSSSPTPSPVCPPASFANRSSPMGLIPMRCRHRWRSTGPICPMASRPGKPFTAAGIRLDWLTMCPASPTLSPASNRNSPLRRHRVTGARH